MKQNNEDPDNGSLSFRYLLATRVKKEIQNRNWGQAEAARELQTTQSRISYVINLKVEHLAEKSLFKMLIILGYEIDTELIEEQDSKLIRLNIQKFEE